VAGLWRCWDADGVTAPPTPAAPGPPGPPGLARRVALRTGRQRRVLDRDRAGTGTSRAERGLDAALAHLRAGGGTPAVPVPAEQVPGTATGDGLTWAPRDADDPTWWPQGVACLRGGEVLLVGWYERPTGPWWRRRLPRSRVSVVDRSDPARPRYMHVELVVPRRGPLARVLPPGPVPVHAGGLAVVERGEGGPLLLVADTLVGLRAFALDDLALRCGCWVLPQRSSVRVPLLRGVLADLRSGRRPDPFRFSFAGAVPPSTGGAGGAGSGPGLVVGEYRRAGACTPDGVPRLLRYRLDPATGLPAGRPGARGGEPEEVHAGQPPRMQGVAVLPAPGGGLTWFLSASAGHDRCGDLHVGAPGAWTTHRGALPPGCEDLDPERPGDPTSPLWGASEHPGRRWVFAVVVPAGRTTADPPSAGGPRVRA